MTMSKRFAGKCRWRGLLLSENAIWTSSDTSPDQCCLLIDEFITARFVNIWTAARTSHDGRAVPIPARSSEAF